MEKVINLLYDIEEKANHIVKRANEEKVKLQEQLDKDLEKLDQEIAAQTSSKLGVLKAEIDKELTLEKQSLINDCNKQLSDMEINYLQNHNVLVDKVIQEIIHA